MNQSRKDIVRSNSASAPRILVVEDESDLALLLAYNLGAEGYVVGSMERGDEAELRLAENPPDLVILDWMLPGVSGLEICRRLRARENTRTLPVIMLTARGEEAERVRGLSVGADDYVVKPFSVPELMARVRALLRRSRPERIADRLNAGDLDLDRAAETGVVFEVAEAPLVHASVGQVDCLVRADIDIGRIRRQPVGVFTAQIHATIVALRYFSHGPLAGFQRA